MATRKIQEIQAVNFIPKNKKPVRGNGDLNSWQKDCQAKIDSWKRAIISSPTGSGKSALAMVRGAVLLARNSKLKHLVSVPQNIIATSFTKESLEEKLPKAAWPGIGKLTWCVSSKDSSSKVSELYNFLVGNTSKTPSKRLMVCTHQALVAVFRKLQDDGKLDVLKNVVLTIDEVHHSMSFEAEDATIENRLGEVVKHFFENDLRMDMFTATFMRGNFMDIIPAKYKEGKDFVKYVRHIDEHLEEKGISVSIRFLICSAEDALKRIYQENSSMKTIVYLPPVNSWVMSGYGSKYDMLSELQGVLKKKVKSIDLVSEEGREVRKNDFLNNIGKDEPDLLFALNMCKEGFDWPVASRAVVIGIRGSMVDTIQMLGRLLRGVDGKAKQVEFNIVMPVSEDPEPELIRDYLNVVLHQLIIDWQFRRPKLVNVKDQKVADKVFSESPTIGQKVLSAGLDAIIGASDEADV